MRQAASLDSVVSHRASARSAGERAWHAEARQEFYAVLSTELRDNDALRVSYDGAAQFRLKLAGSRRWKRIISPPLIISIRASNMRSPRYYHCVYDP